MAHLEWSNSLDTGISVIDEQHKRIVDYINELHDAQQTLDKRRVGEVIDELVDYTVSHFAFEESLMEQAGYPFLEAHKQGTRPVRQEGDQVRGLLRGG
ncbi:MAG: bacteriohemerythrin [Candidatus Sedimenticola endophacoides]